MQRGTVCRQKRVLRVTERADSVRQFLNQNEKREQSGPEERLIASRLLDKKSNLMKYADKYAAVLEDFSAIAPDMQKLLADLIHKMARA